MKKDFILTQRKEVIMTSDKTVTVIDERLKQKICSEIGSFLIPVILKIFIFTMNLI